MGDDLVTKSNYYTKRKLRALLEILKGDMKDFSKVHQSIGFVQSMLKQYDEEE